MRCTQVRDNLAAHKEDLKKFWRRARATKGKSWLLVVAGESEFVPSDPTATSPVVLKALCAAGHFNPNLYVVRTVEGLVAAANSPLMGVIAHLLRENHSGDSVETFLKIERPEDICSMTNIFCKDDQALAAGRGANLYVIAAGDSGEPNFSQVFSCKRRGEHAVVETVPLETLFESAIDESRSSIAMELRRHVGALHGDALAAIELRLAARDALKCDIEDRLEAARANGKEPQLVLLGYQPKFSIGGGRGASTDFVVTETALRSFVDFEAMSRKAADEGLRLLDLREASLHYTIRDEGVSLTRGGLADFLAVHLPPSDKALREKFVVLVPDGTVFPETSDSFPNDIRDAAKRGRMFVASVLDLFAAQPELLDDLLDQQLDCCRPWVPASPAHREQLRTLGGAALVGGPNRQSVVFNTAVKEDGTSRFRTAAAVAAGLAEARAKQKAEPHQALSAQTNSQKMEVLDLEKMLVNDPEGERSLNVDGAQSLIAKWTEQVGLFDDDNSYTVRWGGRRDQVRKDFKDMFNCGYNYPNAPRVNGRVPALTGAPLMRYFITVLEGAIKDATGDEEED